ncbi:MAG: hypothetical protein CMJ89_09000 [Planctomycetes bacterium]|nr:hypothetical protein [Planctomycetota bacterium]
MSHRKPSADSIRRPWTERSLAFLFTTLATWPLLWNLPLLTRLADPTLDDCIYYWNDWWVFEALRAGTNPFFCTEVFHPHGTSLVLSPLAFPLTLVALPFQLWLEPLHGAVVATKLCMFASFPLAILGMARFLRRTFSMAPWPAFAAGCLFAFLPFRMLHLGRVHYLMGALVPWFLERLVTSLRGGGRKAYLGAGGFFALAGACDASLLPEMGLAGCAVVAFEWGRRGSIGPREFLQRAGWAFGCGGLFFAPLLIPMLFELRANPGFDVVSQLRFEERPDSIQLAFSPDLNNLAWYTAPSLHEAAFPAGSGLAQGSAENRVIWSSMHGKAGGSGLGVFASAVLFLATIVAFLGGLRRELWPFLALGCLGALLALGPFRRIGDSVVTMPHYWLAKGIPGLAAGRYVAANLRLCHLGLAIAVAFGVQRLWRWAGPGLVGLAALACLGWWARPFHYRPIEHEGVYEAVAADPAPGAIIDLPHDFRPNLRRMALGQVLHRRRMCGGPVTRVPPELVRAFTEDLLPVPRLLAPPAPRTPEDPELQVEIAENERLLAEIGIRFVILRRRLLRDPAHLARLRGYLECHPNLSVREIDGHLLVRVDHW